MQGKKLFVGNLSYTTTEDELKEAFAEHGTVESAKIISGKGFGFVEMATSGEAESAKEALNQTSIGGRNINVDEARPLKDKPRDNFRRF